MEGKILSTRTLAKMWGVTRAKATHTIHNSENWVRADPCDVGSMKDKLNIWKLSDHAKTSGYSIAQDKYT